VTHDELVAQIGQLDCTVDKGYDGVTVSAKGYDLLKHSFALLEIVQLHEPEHSVRGYRCVFDDEAYPCLTIEVIEKVLK